MAPTPEHGRQEFSSLNSFPRSGVGTPSGAGYSALPGRKVTLALSLSTKQPRKPLLSG